MKKHTYLFIFVLLLVNNIYAQKSGKIIKLGVNYGTYYKRLQTFESVVAKEEFENNYAKPFNYHSYDMGYQIGYLFPITKAADGKLDIYYGFGFMHSSSTISNLKKVGNGNLKVTYKAITNNIQMSKIYFRLNKFMMNLTIFDLYFLNFTKQEGNAALEMYDRAPQISTALDFGADYFAFKNLSIGFLMHIPATRATGAFGDYTAGHIQLQLNYNFITKPKI